MYVSHFGFHRQPFHSADSGRAFFVSESIQNILPQLLHALRSDLGIAVLTGVPGSGKTSLLRHIQQQVSNEGRALVCSGASLGTSADLFSVLLEAARRKAGTAELSKTAISASSPQESRNEILEQIRRTAELWGPVLLLIDDAQLMPLQVLNELRACTEEVWNGRDLVRCLVTAPIAFEDQLARTEYAEFGRRIRCHAFLQPLKSSESLRFLQEQIELAGGRLSNVFSAAALELISTAAAGIPRCLILLADESLVVAMQNDETIASENSVRRALGRLQHLQYNWNVSPDSDMVDTLEVALLQPSSSQHPIQSSGSTGVIEFGGHGLNVSRPATSKPAAGRVPGLNCASLAPGVIEFGRPATQSGAGAESSSVDNPAAAPVERFTFPEADSKMSGEVLDLTSFSRSTEHTESLAETESDIQRSSAYEFDISETIADHANPATPATSVESGTSFEVGRRFFAESSSDSVSIEEFDDSEIVNLLHSDSTSGDSEMSGSVSLPRDPVESGFGTEGLEIYWIDGNAHVSIPERAAEEDVDGSVLEEVSGSANSPVVTDEYSAAAAGDITEPNVNTFVYTTPTDFVDSGNSRQSVCTPVFDRYTWIALGRDMPPGTNPAESSNTPGRSAVPGIDSIIQAESSFESMAQGPRSTSIDHIPVARTPDNLLMDRIRGNSLNLESGSFVALQHEPVAASHTSDVPVLKIWHDGQLIFPDFTESEPVSAPESEVLPTKSSGPATSSVATGQIEAGGFFTLPISVDRIEWDLRALDSADDTDVFPIVETLAGLRAEVRQFQQTGRTLENGRSGSESTGTESRDVPAGEPGADNLVSRAKRRLDEQNLFDESNVVALQLTSAESRPLRETSETTISPRPLQTEEPAETTPQLSRLFTRLWESRRREAGEIANP